LAEKNDGGYEWEAGWQKRNGWTYKNPDGFKAESLLEPAVYINKFEAENYCKSINGRLPNFNEWKVAAYQQLLTSQEFERNKIYKYPSGDIPKNMNSQGLLNYNKHMDVTKPPEGINGLVTKGEDSLTAGASWWYGSSMTKVTGAQYKPFKFYAIYVGFVCVFDK